METGVIFVLMRNQKILMQQRDKYCKKFPMMWCIPGGTRNENEDYDETLLREIKEEYGLDVNLNNCKYLMDYNHDKDKVYICDIAENQTPIMNEGRAMKWMNVHEIEQLELAFNQERIVTVLKEIIMK